MAIIPSTPPFGTVTSAVILKSLFMTLGALSTGIPGLAPVYVKTVRPAVALGRGVVKRGRIELSNGSTWYFAASVRNNACSSRNLSGALHVSESAAGATRGRMS